MEKNITDAIEDINMIKSTMENTKINFSGTYWLCFIRGTYHILSFLVFFISVWNPGTKIILFTNPVLIIGMFIGFIIIYNSEKKHTNRFYLSFLSIWGIIVIAIPTMIFLIRIINYFYFRNDSVNLILLVISSFTNALLFCICIIIYAFLIKKKYPIFLSLGILFTYLFVSTCLNNVGLPFNTALSNDTTLLLASIFTFIFIDVGYILLGFALMKRSK
ncbi:MAG: hypothetical protein LBV33_02215 [Lachnospiraceae bacterium]|nr:hypothetical protein [Lachnospiraceae bacterium]